MGTQALLRTIDVETPIVQAPMAGGSTTPELVAAVSAAGGLGSLGAAYLTAAQLDTAIRAIRAVTDRPFAVNVFAGGYEDAARAVDPGPMLELLASIHRELGLDPPTVPTLTPDPFGDQLEVVLDARPAVFSSMFAGPSVARARAVPAGDLVREIALEAAERAAPASLG
jgi:nitronate monooxygenase